MCKKVTVPSIISVIERQEEIVRKIILCISVIFLYTCKLNNRTNSEYQYDIVDDASLIEFLDGTWFCECLLIGEKNVKNFYFDADKMTFTGIFHDGTGRKVHFYQKIENEIIYSKPINEPVAEWRKEYLIENIITNDNNNKMDDSFNVKTLSNDYHNGFIFDHGENDTFRRKPSNL